MCVREKLKLTKIGKIKKELVRNVNSLKVTLFMWTLISAFGIIICESDVRAGEDIFYNAHGRRDPFIPLVTQAARTSSGLAGVETAEEVTIEGVVYDPEHGSVVVINGSVLKEGEESGSVKVLRIRSDGAWFLINGAQVFKPMYQSETQKEKNA